MFSFILLREISEHSRLLDESIQLRVDWSDEEYKNIPVGFIITEWIMCGASQYY